jgi:hypothetical protein
MVKGELEYAVRHALLRFDKWNNVTGYVPLFSSYYYEICSIIEDAVKIGSKIAIYGKNADLEELDEDK